MSRYECFADEKAAGFPINKACEVASELADTNVTGLTLIVDDIDPAIRTIGFATWDVVDIRWLVSLLCDCRAVERNTRSQEHYCYAR